MNISKLYYTWFERCDKSAKGNIKFEIYCQILKIIWLLWHFSSLHIKFSRPRIRWWWRVSARRIDKTLVLTWSYTAHSLLMRTAIRYELIRKYLWWNGFCDNVLLSQRPFTPSQVIIKHVCSVFIVHRFQLYYNLIPHPLIPSYKRNW